MIVPANFCQFLQSHGISFYAGVPDSLLKNLCAYIDDAFDAHQHVITANEGNAIAMAMGHFLATGDPAVAYMQNSGLGNAVNPILSMVSEAVCSIPMLLIIGWRGEPSVHDEPQHIKQGAITPDLLDLMGIPHVVLDGSSNVEEICTGLLESMVRASKPVAVLVRKDTFSETAIKKELTGDLMLREVALSIIESNLRNEDLVIATTGKTSRELYELQMQTKAECTAFLTVGAMGHASSIAASVAMAKPEKQVFCLDGDGALLMHMGALAIIGKLQPHNFVHVLINNEAHESVGGQPTCIASVDVKSLVLASGYKQYVKLESEAKLDCFWKNTRFNDGPWFVEVVVRVGSRKDLGRPKQSPLENANSFLEFALQE